MLPIQKEEILIVEKKAKKHKKFLEKIEVNRNPVAINGKHYYQVVYINRGEEVKGGAILSPKEEVEAEIREIHYTLTMYNALIVSFYTGGAPRAKVSDSFFARPLRVMEESPSPLLEEGKQKIERLYELHLEHKRVYEETLAKIRSTFVVSEDDLHALMETAAELDQVYFEILLIMTRDIPVIENWIEQMKKNGGWKQLDRETQKFYEYMVKDKHKTEKHLATKTGLVGDTKEEMIANKLKASWKHNDEMERGYRKQLRWPKPW
ncbi:hypothetical protein [Jeotgalibacillus sp. JSM ZJ347]|uniref:hypothetical protein n=1 Tax=Jeotgalibacillus sp. JSM ZJ347 TaxID=3342117 RepID=UPI0035A971F6